LTYEIVLTIRAVKDLENLDKKTKKRIIDYLKENNINPLAHAIKLTNPKLGSYRFKIGDYRVVFDIDNKTLVILRIGHRKSIYR